MNRQNVEREITAYLKPIFGFALRRCKNTQDAEDLSQEIAIKAFRALLYKDDVADMGKFIWTVAHHTLCNYYRDTAKSTVGVPMEDLTELTADPYSEIDSDDTDSIHRLLSEIAYLSKLQRKIVIAYYFENRKQAEIAGDLGIPLGTVKWHLFEAKKELKRGMETMRKASELKFNPIKFYAIGINGNVGTTSPNDVFRSALSQNICYCVRNVAKTVNEIAEDLGVSPVYVETEVDFLEEYGFLQAKKDRYIVNFIINEPTAELLMAQNDMYQHAAELFANDLYDALTECGILDDERILCNHTISDSTEKKPLRDKNFLLWTLIPYIAAWSGESRMDEKISFEEVATIRPDGGHNIVHASVMTDSIVLPKDYVSMNNWCGPMWNSNKTQTLWQIDSEWSNRGPIHGFQYAEEAQRVLSLFAHEPGNRLSKEDYAWLSERGYMVLQTDRDGNFKTVWKMIVLRDNAIKKELIAIGDCIKKKYEETFSVLRYSYAESVLRSVPAHLRRIKEYELQFVFSSDGWFLLHCIIALLKNGKLKQPTIEQQKSLMTLIFPN